MTMGNDALGTFFGQTSGGVSSQLAQQLQMFQQALQFQQQQAAQTLAQNYSTQFGQAPGGNWMTWGAGGPTQPPTGTPTLTQGQAVGSVGYIPGQTGFNSDQTLAALNQYANLAAQQAGLTGAYTAPGISQYSPGSFVQLDPNSPEGQQYGQQLGYVQPSGQIQRISADQAQSMGYKGNASTVPYQQFMSLAQAPPQGYTQQTQQAQQQYFTQNQQALQAALAQAQTTGMFSTPGQIQAPGFAVDGSSYFSQPAATQQAYMAREKDPQAAMQAWVNDTNAAVNQQYAAQGLPPPGGAGTPQETQQAQQQYFNQAAQLAQMYGNYFAPGAPGQAGQAGVNAPAAGQQTLASILQGAQLSGMYNGSPTETAREFNATNALQQGQLGQQYLSTAAQLQGPQNTFQLSNYLRGAQGNQNVPVYLQALQSNLGLPSFQGTGDTTPTANTMGGLQQQMGGSGTNAYTGQQQGTGAGPGWDYNSTLNSINNIAQRGAQALGPGSLEKMSPDEMQAFGSGLGAAGYSLPSFMSQYNASRVGQNAPVTAMGLS
jgi:hypothetical protein